MIKEINHDSDIFQITGLEANAGGENITPCFTLKGDCYF